MIENTWLLYVLIFFTVGLVSGFISGLFSVGGGIVRVPIFLHVFTLMGMHQSVIIRLAIGTSLALAILSNALSSRAQIKAGNADNSFLKMWLPALSLGVMISFLLMHVVSEKLLITLFILLLLAESMHLLFSKKNKAITETLPSKFTLRVLAMAIGTLSPLIGITGGTIVTPVLSALSYPMKKAMAISAIGGLFISVLGTFSIIVHGIGVAHRPHYSLGYIDLTAFFVMLPAIYITTPFGVRLANQLNKQQLKRVFGFFLIIVIIDMLHHLLRITQ